LGHHHWLRLLHVRLGHFHDLRLLHLRWQLSGARLAAHDPQRYISMHDVSSVTP
jgi:hypothetical protein